MMSAVPLKSMVALLLCDLIPSELRDEIFCALDRCQRKSKSRTLMRSPYLAIMENILVLRFSKAREFKMLPILKRFKLSFSKLMFPNGDDNFCETVHQYATLLSQFNQLLIKMVFESYGIEKHCDNHIDSTTYLLRVNKYRVHRDDEISMGIPVHTDKSFITILYQIQVSGLQVQTKDEQWISVDFLPSSFVVMAGDGMQAWSNGRVLSPLHRVVMRGKETRYSLGIFTYHKGIIQMPEELIDEEHPRRFKAFDHLGLVSFYSKEIEAGRLQGSDIKAYCGV